MEHNYETKKIITGKVEKMITGELGDEFCLLLPDAAVTKDSIALIWNRQGSGENTEMYQIFVNGALAGCSTQTDYTLTGLTEDTLYEIKVCAVMKDGAAVESSTIQAVTRGKAKIYDITAYGAVEGGDEDAVSTDKIQAAIDDCCKGGIVYIPRGIFRTGALFLKSDMTLFLENGSKILGSAKTKDYPLLKYRFEGIETDCYASLINAIGTKDDKLHDIIIEGGGTIDACGSRLLKAEIEEGKGKRGRAVCFQNTENSYLYNVTIRQSPAWCVHFIYCNRISLNQVSIHTKYDEQGNVYEGIWNGDGFDPDSCSNIYLFHSMIDSQDDCVAIKSGRNKEGRMVNIPSENILIKNCIFKSGFGVAVGSEMSGCVRNVLVQDCTFTDTFSAASIKTQRGRGGVIEKIRFERIRHENRSQEHSDCEWFKGAIYVDQFYGHKVFDDEEEMEITDETPVIRALEFIDVCVDTKVSTAIYLTGLRESPLQNIYLKNVKAKGKNGLHAVNVDGLILENVAVKSDAMAYSCKNVLGYKMR